MANAADPACRNCGKTMRTVAEIAPANNGPGLRAFRCDCCGISAGVLLYAPPTVNRQVDSANRKDRVSDFA
jgi:hypothetical protein